MNTLIFLCGAGVGALTTVILMITLMHVLARENRKNNVHIRQQNDETLAQMKRRNSLLEHQNDILEKAVNQRFGVYAAHPSQH